RPVLSPSVTDPEPVPSTPFVVANAPAQNVTPKSFVSSSTLNGIGWFRLRRWVLDRRRLGLVRWSRRRRHVVRVGHQHSDAANYTPQTRKAGWIAPAGLLRRV